MDVLFRLAVAVFCIVAPSLLFVGLCRGLDRLRDDPFVDQVLERVDETPAPGSGPAAVLTGGSFAPSKNRATMTACNDCGAPNPAYVSYCGACLEKLES